MADDSTDDELARLRAQVAALKESKVEVAIKPPQTMPEPEPILTPVASNATAPEAVVEDTEEVENQLDELMKLLENEIRDLPTITCLAVFTLGILMGRLLR